jgi:hypothetical protein
MRTTRWLLLLLVLVCAVPTQFAQQAFAVFSITNGGFDAQDGSINNNATVTPTGWFNESNAANSFSDNILNVQRGANGAISNLGGASVGMWDANGLALGRNAPFGNDGTLETGYVYQSIGTYSGEASVGITGFVYNRTNGNRVGDFNVSIYYTSPGAFTPAVGTDIAGAGTLVGALQLFSQVTAAVPTTPNPDDIELLIESGTVAQSASWTHSVNFAGSGITNGSLVWLRIGDAGNPDGLLFDEPIIDNVRLAGCDLGSTDCSGPADLADFNAIRTNFRKTTGVTRAMGDLDGSGDVDQLDYLQWRRAFLAGGGSLASIPAFGVPEPSAALLSGMAAIFVAGMRRSRSR